MTFPQVLDRWLRRVTSEIVKIFIPGAAALLIFDMNFGIFQGEFTLEQATSINGVLGYYADRLEAGSPSQLTYILTMGFMTYFLGYFLYSSSKYFSGPQKMRVFLRAGEHPVTLDMEVPAAVRSFLNLKPEEFSRGREICLSVVEASGLNGELHALENRTSMFRSFGYLFSLMALVDIALFLISFDFSSLTMKLCMVILNLVFAFLFFKGQEECSARWRDQLASEAIVAANRLGR
jgi:hypothetical protein